MGSALRPPKALSDRSSEVKLGRVRSEVHSERSDWGISEMSRPVKMSLKSATCACRGERVSSRALKERGGRGHALEVVLVLEGAGDALARVDAERVAAKADLPEGGDLGDLVEVRLGLVERVELELAADERVEGIGRLWGVSRQGG